MATNKDFVVKNGLQVGENASIAGSITTVDSIQFDTTAGATVGPGILAWNADAGTLDLGLNTDVTLQLGQETHVYVKAGEAITDGDVVYASDAVGNSGKIEVSKYIANNTIEERRVIGVATESATSGEFFYVTTFGAIRGVSTDGSTAGGVSGAETWNEGDILYASPYTAGKLTNVQPEAPNQAIAIAFVLSKNASNGVLMCRAYDLGYHLGELHDVHITSVANNDILIWDNNRWVNSANASLSLGNLTVTGDLTVTGNTTSVNSNNLTIEDLNITLASGAANSAIADGAGITIDGANATLTWNETSSRMDLNKNLYINSGANTSGTSQLTIESQGTAGILLLSDSTNGTGEPGGAFVKLFVDNSLTGGILSFVQNSGEDGAGGSFQDTFGNSILLGNYEDLPVQIGQNSAVRMTIARSGTEPRVGIGTIAPSEVLHLRGDAPNLLIDNTTETTSTIRFLDNQSAGSQYYDIRFNSGGSNPANPVIHEYMNTSYTTTQLWNAEGPIKITAVEPLIHLESANANKSIYLRTENASGSVYWGKDNNVGTFTGVANSAFVSVSGANDFIVKQNSANTFKITDTGSVYNYNNQPSIAPTLNLDFANSKRLDPRITFYRDSIATYYDSKGVLRYANHNEPRFDHDPATGESKGLLVEETRTNLLYAPLNNGFWTVYDCQVTPNSELAPDGKYSAYKITRNSTAYGGGVFVYHSGTSFSVNTGDTRSISIYLKAGTQSVVRWNMDNSGTGGYPMSGGGGEFDLINGTSTNANIEDVGNGWYRCIVTATATTSGTLQLGLYVPDGDMSVGDYFYAWGPQMESGLYETSYIPADIRFTSRSSVATYYDETGILRTAPANTPRYGYKYDGRKWVETGLILENSATNYVKTTTEAFGVGYNNGNYNVSVVDNTSDTLAPNGTYTASKVTGGSSDPNIFNYSTHYTPSPFSNGTIQVNSVYAKEGTTEFIWMSMPSTSEPNASFNLNTGQVTRITSGLFHAGMEYAGNGWWRCYIMGIVTGTPANSAITISIANDGTGSRTSSDYVYLWGKQVETNTLTSYISNYTLNTTATRSADVASSVAYTREIDDASIRDENFESFFNLDEGTLFANYISGSSTFYQGVASISDGTYNNRITLSNDGTAAGTIDAYWIVSQDGTNQAVPLLGNPAANSEHKLVGAYALNDFAGSLDGNTVVTDTTGTIPPAVNQLIIGNDSGRLYPLNRHIKKIAYYDQRLSNAELQALTENN